MDSEKKIQEKIIKYLNSLEGYSFDKKQASPYGNKNGFSDLVGVVNGRACYIEVKSHTGTPTGLQVLFLKEKKRCGALAGFARSIDEAMDICAGGVGAGYIEE